MTLSTVPSKYQIGLNDRPYMLDEKSNQHRHKPVPFLRAQADNSPRPSEQSVNPDNLWRRSAEDWGLGAGQSRFDDVLAEGVRASDRRFRASKGIDVFSTESCFQLHWDTFQGLSSANTNLRMVPAGSRLYVLDGTAVKYTTDPTAASWTTTTVTSTGSNTKLSITSDGYNVWFTDGSDVYVTNTGTSAASSLDTEDIDLLAYVKGRLMGAEDNEVFYWNGSDFTSLFAHGNTQFSWVGFAEGQVAIYAAGYAGDKSLIYRITLKPDATGLDQPIVAGTLPDGEIVRSIGGYLGFIFVGTDKGWRFCIPDGQGNLQIGGLVATGSAVRCFEGQDRFMWLGLTNYDGTTTGLARADLSVFAQEDRQTIAYATDLLTPTASAVQGNVLDVCTFGDKRYFAVSGSGFWCQSANKVASGQIDSGVIGFGIADDKIGLYLDMRFSQFAGAYAGTTTAYISVDETYATFTSIGNTTTGADVSFSVGALKSAFFEVRVKLDRYASDTTKGPIVDRWTLRAQPAADVTTQIILPLKIHEYVDDVSGSEPIYLDPNAELSTLKALHAAKTVVTLQEGPDNYSVILDDYEWVPTNPCNPAGDNQGAWNGTFVAVCKVI